MSAIPTLHLTVHPSGHVQADIKRNPGSQSRGKGKPITVGSSRGYVNKITWFSKAHRKQYLSWAFAWRDLTNKRLRKKFRSAQEAAEFGLETLRSIQNGKALLGTATPADLASLSRALELLAKIGSPPLEVAVGIYTDLVQKLAGRATPDQILQYWLDHNPLDSSNRLIPDVVAEMLEQMQLNQAGERWIDDLRSRLQPKDTKWKQPVKPFTQAFTGTVNDLRALALNDWLGNLKLSPRSRNNYRGAILALVAFAKSKGYLPRAWSEMESVQVEKIKRKRVLIYEPDQCRDLLRCALPNLVPFIAIQAFAGVRTREILGDSQHDPLKWSDVRLKQRCIHVPADVAKEGTPERIIPLPENLAAWLAPYARRKSGSEPVCALANVTNALTRTARRAGVPFIRNGLRKSFISYRLAIVKDIGRVADEAGNSPQVIRTNYRDVRSEEDGHRWFNIGTLQLSLDLQEQA